jgi:hypothetical protein
MVAFLVARGWRRQQEGSGWWWREKYGEATLGFAVEQEIDDELDTREMVVGEPREFWDSAPGTGASRKDNRGR